MQALAFIRELCVRMEEPRPWRGSSIARRTVARLTALLVCGVLAWVCSIEPAGAAECPNEAFRVGASAALPDCRAYELVSPQAKNGGGVLPQEQPFGSIFGKVALFSSGAAAAQTGDGVVYSSFASFAGGESASLVSFYRAERDPLAWSTVGISPPQLAAPTVFNTRVEMVSPDLSNAVVVSNADLTGDVEPGTVAGYLRDPGGFRFVAPSSDGITSGLAAATPELSHLLVETSLELTPEAESLPDESPKLYLWEEGTLSLVSKVPTSLPGPGVEVPASGSAGALESSDADPSTGAISDSGDVIYFTAATGGEPLTETNQFLFRRQGGSSVLVTQEENGSSVVSPGPAEFVGATPSGRFAYFISSQQLVDADTNSTADLYRYDAAAEAGHHLVMLSADQEPEPPDGSEVQGVLGFSDDGSRVYFVAANQIVAGADPTPEEKLYLWDEGEVRYLGGLPSSDDQIWSPGTAPDRARTRRIVSADGEHLLLTTESRLSAADNGEKREVYLYGALGDAWTCISCPTDGTPPSDAVKGLYAESNADVFRYQSRRNITADGARAFFMTATALSPRDTNGELDVYEWDGEPRLISSGKSPSSSIFVDASAGGNDVFFATLDRLAGGDLDNLSDLYDARVDGGMPSPPSAPPRCRGEDCLDDGEAGIASTDIATSAFQGRGNVSGDRHRKCRHGKRRRHGRCVVPHKHRRHNGKRGRR